MEHRRRGRTGERRRRRKKGEGEERKKEKKGRNLRERERERERESEREAARQTETNRPLDTNTQWCRYGGEPLKSNVNKNNIRIKERGRKRVMQLENVIIRPLPHPFLTRSSCSLFI